MTPFAITIIRPNIRRGDISRFVLVWVTSLMANSPVRLRYHSSVGTTVRKNQRHDSHNNNEIRGRGRQRQGNRRGFAIVYTSCTLAYIIALRKPLQDIIATAKVVTFFHAIGTIDIVFCQTIRLSNLPKFAIYSIYRAYLIQHQHFSDEKETRSISISRWTFYCPGSSFLSRMHNSSPTNPA